MVVVVQGLYTGLSNEFAIDALLLDKILEGMEVGQFEVTNGRVFRVGEEKWLAMASVLGTISASRVCLRGHALTRPVAPQHASRASSNTTLRGLLPATLLSTR